LAISFEFLHDDAHFVVAQEDRLAGLKCDAELPRKLFDLYGKNRGARGTPSQCNYAMIGQKTCLPVAQCFERRVR
jgi:hypothetical protein